MKSPLSWQPFFRVGRSWELRRRENQPENLIFILADWLSTWSICDELTLMYWERRRRGRNKKGTYSVIGQFHWIENRQDVWLTCQWPWLLVSTWLPHCWNVPPASCSPPAPPEPGSVWISRPPVVWTSRSSPRSEILPSSATTLSPVVSSTVQRISIIKNNS